MLAALPGPTRAPSVIDARFDDWIVIHPLPLDLTGSVNQPVYVVPAVRMIVSPSCELLSALVSAALVAGLKVVSNCRRSNDSTRQRRRVCFLGREIMAITTP